MHSWPADRAVDAVAALARAAARQFGCDIAAQQEPRGEPGRRGPLAGFSPTKPDCVATFLGAMHPMREQRERQTPPSCTESYRRRALVQARQAFACDVISSYENHWGFAVAASQAVVGRSQVLVAETRRLLFLHRIETKRQNRS